MVCHVCWKKSWPERKMGVGEERRGKERGGGGMTEAERERESETGSQWRVKSCSSCISGEATVHPGIRDGVLCSCHTVFTGN